MAGGSELRSRGCSYQEATVKEMERLCQLIRGVRQVGLVLGRYKHGCIRGGSPQRSAVLACPFTHFTGIFTGQGL